ncbi:MAG: metallophosphoesterase [Clostridia bacterium]|nr:metallophosphoesterase [Clostridia bacterium]
MSPLISIPIYILLSALAGWMTDLCLRKWPRTANSARRRARWMIPYGVLSLLPLAGAFLPDSPVKFALQAAGNVWLGFFLYYGGTLLVLLVLARLVRLCTRGRVGRWHGPILCLAATVALVTGVYGLVHAQHTVVRRYDVPIEKDGDDMKVVLIADLHLSVNSRLATTEKMVELVNAEAPDLVVVAGDIFTSSYAGLREPDRYAEALRGMKAKYGVYAVYGNHDVEETLFGGFPISPVSKAFRTAEMEAFFDACGFVTLTDEVVTLPNGYQLAGRLDGEKAGDGTTDRMTAAELLSDIDPEKPVLVLEHEPRGFAELKAAGADAAFCGHTHNGQLFPGDLIVPLFNENAWGYAEIGGLDTVVTAGVGYYGPPMRVGTDSEVSVVTVRCTGKHQEN